MYRYLIPSLSFLLSVAIYCYTWSYTHDFWHYHTLTKSGGVQIQFRTHERTGVTQNLGWYDGQGWITLPTKPEN